MCFVIEVDIGFNLIAKLFNSSLVWNNPVLIFFCADFRKKRFLFWFFCKDIQFCRRNLWNASLFDLFL